MKEKIKALRLKLGLHQINMGKLFGYATGSEQQEMTRTESRETNNGIFIRMFQLLEFVHEKGLLPEFIERIGIKFYPQKGNARGMGRALKNKVKKS